MLRPDCKITLTQNSTGRGNSFVITSVKDIEIQSSWKNLTDTGKLVFARKYVWEGKDLFYGSDPLIRRGDKISIELGYNQSFNSAFTGYISQVNTEVEVEVAVEDEMFLLKQKTLPAKAYRAVSLNTLLSDTIGSTLPYVATIDYTNLGKFTIQNGATPALVLEELRRTYGIESFVRSGTLYVGSAYLYEYSNTKATSVQEVFQFQENIVSSNLEYRAQDSVKLFAKATAIYNDGTGANKKRTVTVGDLGGAQRTFYYYQDYSETELRAIAQRDLDKVRYNGYFGRFRAFGEPFVRHGDRAKIVDKRLTERDGVYLIKSVRYSFGWDGYFQDIELGARVL